MRAPQLLPGDVGFLGQLGPLGPPLRYGQAELVAELPDLRGEGLADFVVVTELELEPSIYLVLRRSGTSEDVHRPDVPLGEGRLSLLAGPGVLGELLHPVLAVADVELLLFEDAVDRTHPGAVGRAPHVLELVPGAPVHAEVEEDEIGPRVDRVIENVDPLVARDTR